MNTLTNIEEINYTELVSNSNPNESLSFKSTMVEELKRSFSDDEQKLFIANFYMYLNYDAINDYPINLEDVWKFIGFSNKRNAKKSLTNNFTLDDDYKVTVLPKEHGKFNVENVVLNVETFKNLCMIVKTEKGKQIRKYFLKLENVYNKVLHQDYIRIEKNAFKMSKQQLLLDQYANVGPIVYIIKVSDLENGQYVIKIGESRKGIRDRFKNHQSDYGANIILLECFRVLESKRMESFLHSKLYQVKYKKLPGHEKENELFLIGTHVTLNQVVDLVKENKTKFDTNENEIEKLKLEIEKMKLEQENTRLLMNSKDYMNITKKVLDSLHDTEQRLNNKMDTLTGSVKQLMDLYNQQQNRVTTGFNEHLNTIGPRLQKINAESLQLVKVYDTMNEAIKESKYTLKRPSLNKAIKENTIYHGFRWNTVNRDEDVNIVNVSSTRELKKEQNLGYICKLDDKKSEIVNVYLNRSIASLSNDYKSSGSLDTVVQKGSLSNGYYYMLYHDCSDTLRKNFEQLHGKPILYKDGIGKYDLDNNLVQTFVSKMDCYTNDSLGNKSLTKALSTGKPYNGFYYRNMNEKLSMI